MVIKYTAITFAPVQGFIEKSRKLRDLYGASLILSYLSQQIVQEAAKTIGKDSVISPAVINLQKGMPNRILLKGEFSEQQVKEAILSAWKALLQECQDWIQKKLNQYEYQWEREWRHWGNHTWEIFWGEGTTIAEAMEDLETRKLSRGWIGVNWIGESSSLTGTDAIAFPGLGAEDRNPNNKNWRTEKSQIDDFYRRLSCVLENLSQNDEPEGKFLDPSERLSIPELSKRLVTHEDIANKLKLDRLEDSFSDVYRFPEKANQGEKGRWTGWFMGDGDKVGDYLKELTEDEIKVFSKAMRDWGKDFSKTFPAKLGRIVYAGGDDFLGVIYSDKKREPIQPKQALEWLMKLPEEWQKHKQPINLSVGFVWVGHSVPQRDILQHCREAEKRAKSLGRNRVTLRVVFNSGQYVQWTCPWNHLNILNKYKDKESGTNWSHVYNDLAQLEYRRAFKIDEKTFDKKFACDFFDIYFPGEGKKLLDYQFAQYVVGFNDDDDGYERAKAIIDWISDLIKVGWQLCSNT